MENNKSKMVELDDSLVEEGLLMLRKSLGKEVYSKITITYQEQILFILDLIYGLEKIYNSKGMRKWFLRPKVELNDETPVKILSGEWKITDKKPNEIRALVNSLEKDI